MPRPVLLVPLLPWALTALFGRAARAWQGAPRWRQLAPVAALVLLAVGGGPFAGAPAAAPYGREAIELLRRRLDVDPGGRERVLGSQVDTLLLHAGLPRHVPIQLDAMPLHRQSFAQLAARWRPDWFLDTPRGRRDGRALAPMDDIVGAEWELVDAEGAVRLYARRAD